MRIFSRIHFRSRALGVTQGLRAAPPPHPRPISGARPPATQAIARRTGIRGETFAYWYLRRHGYIIIARNFTVPGMKGEIDLVGYDGAVLAFIEVKTRTGKPAPGACPKMP